MNTTDPNPYAAPADLSTLPGVPEVVRFFRDGKFLAVRDGAELPSVCLLTNEPVEANAWRKRVRIAWTPPWVYVLLLINLIVMVIVAVIIQKKARITYSLGRGARGRIVRRRIIGTILLFACPALVAYSIVSNSNDPSGTSSVIAGVAAVPVLIASLVFFIISNPVKAVKFKNGWFRIKGCSTDFLATLPEYPSQF